jgi:hypothetical protein
MAKPKHRRCGICNTVTARYAGTQNAGAFVIKHWVKDPAAGEVLRVNGTIVRCQAHADVDNKG